MAIGDERLQITGFARKPVVVTGAANRWAQRSGVSTALVRACLIPLAIVGGIGLVLYWLMWRRSVVDPLTTPVGHEARVHSPPGEQFRRSVGLVLLTAAMIVLGGATGITFDQFTWSVFFVALGCAVAWDATLADVRSSVASLRFVVGALLGSLGVIMVMSMFVPVAELVASIIIGACLTAGVAFIIGPRLWEMSTLAIEERQDRIRSEEREAVAAHLHDSVLQTLTLIQRHANDPTAHPRSVAALARRQERDLRRWLYGRSITWEPDSRLRDAFEALVAEIEDLYGVTIEAVIVGDANMAEVWQPLLGASREALTNAAKFAGEQTISLFVEHQRVDESTSAESSASPGEPSTVHVPKLVDRVEVFVRDRGDGFDPDAIAPDRHGISDSIIGRLQRHGGTVSITPTPGLGTEVHMQLTAIVVENSLKESAT